MSIEEKIEQILLTGEYVTGSLIDVETLINEARLKGHELSFTYLTEFEYLVFNIAHGESTVPNLSLSSENDSSFI